MSIGSSISGGGFGDGGAGTASKVAGPGSSTDNAVARFDGTTGLIVQNGLMVEDGAGVVSGATQFSVDNLRLDGNTLSAVSGGISITSATGGGVVITATGDAFMELNITGNQVMYFKTGGTNRFTIDSSGNWNGQTSGQQVTLGGDTGQKRDSAGVWLDTNASSGLGSRLMGRPVEASTVGSGAPNLLLATESRKLITNEGATAEAYSTLPSAAAGYEFVIYCQDTDGIRAVANAGDTIRLGGSVSAAAGFVRSSIVGSSLTLVSINATEWVAISIVGTWTVDI